ncbi:helix-turn-helix domain-containing protein [Alkalimonas sp. NCh-2]|uniref:AraC family transcriptional regulator n=1 Tax=Alkalimonas sp. NCh-2 TaxID=3144846 RepID=UPI0031F6CD3E
MSFHPFGFSQAQQAQLGWRSWLPAIPLRPWLECYYLLRPQSGPQLHRMYPDGGTTLTLPLQQGSIQVCSLSYHTPQSRPAWQPGECLGIRFTPGGFYALFGFSMQELGQQSSAWLTKEPVFATLCAQLAESTPHYASALDHFFLQQLQRRAPQSGAVQLWRQAGLQAQQDIRSLLQQQGVGRRTLERQFQLQVGVSPGQFYQWQRLKRARYLLRSCPEQNLTDIAVGLGYYDQAHFVHQFRQYSGQSPGQYRQRKLSQLYKAG